MRHTVVQILGLLVVGVGPTVPQPAIAQATLDISAVAFEQSVTVPGAPDAVYDAFVRVDDWWDHRHTDDPARFLIQPWPGGLFLEEFESGSGDGAIHARVIWAQRGKELRMEGPLGFSGSAVQIVHSLSFSALEDSTRIDLRVEGHGLFKEGWTEALVAVWAHFLETRFKSFMEGRLDPSGS